MAASALPACAGFLLAVLWMDLIFDTQVRAADPDVASIAAYYRRATTRPMSGLIAAVMATLLVLLAVEALGAQRPGWLMAASAVLAGGPILLALVRTVPTAIRLGRQADPAAEQLRMARTILRDHVLCAVGMLAFLVVWLVEG